MNFSINKELLREMQDAANQEPDKEISGIITLCNGLPKFTAIKSANNTSSNSYFSNNSYIESVRNKELLALVHSHPKTSDFNFSLEDIQQANFSNVVWVLLHGGKEETEKLECLVYYGVYSEVTINGLSSEEIHRISH